MEYSFNTAWRVIINRALGGIMKRLALWLGLSVSAALGLVACGNDSGGIDTPKNLLLIDDNPENAFNYYNVVNVLELEADGTGVFYDALRESEMTWSRTGDTITVVPDEPQVRTFVAVDGLEAIPVVKTEQQLEITLQPAGTAELSWISETTYPENPELESETEIDVEGVRYLADDALVSAFPPADVPVGSAVSADVYNTNDGIDQSGYSADRLVFQSGGMGATAFLGQDFVWSKRDDGLAILTTGGLEMTYQVGASVDDCAKTWLTKSRGVDGARRADLGLAMCDSGDAFVQSDIPGYFYQFGVGDEENPQDDVVGFALRFDADGTGGLVDNFFEDTLDMDGDGEPDRRERYRNEDSGMSRPLEGYSEFFWHLSEEGAVVIQHTVTSADEGGRSPGCVPGSEGCLTYDRRELVPLTIDGTRFYWLEIRQLDDRAFNGELEDVILVQRFYDYSATEVPVDGVSKQTWQNEHRPLRSDIANERRLQ